MLPEYLQNIGEECNAGAEQDQTENIERMGVLLPIIRQVQIHQNETGNADGQVYEENHPPMQVSHDKAAGDGAQPGHVTMYIGSGQVVSANEPGTNVQTQSISYDGQIMGFGRVN